MKKFISTTVLAMVCLSADASDIGKYMSQFKKSANPTRDAKKGKWTQKDEDLQGNFYNMCKADEGQYMQVERSVVNPLISSILNKDVQGLQGFFKDKATLDLFQTDIPEVTSDKMVITPWKGIKTSVGSSEFFTRLGTYLGQYKKIDDVQMVSKKIKSPFSERGNNYEMKSMSSETYFEIRGVTMAGARRVDRGYLDLNFTLTGKEWKIDQFKIVSMDSLQKSKPDFEEVTAQSGIENMPVYERTEAIRRGGYALAIGDYNNDGFMDMYVGAKGPAKLFMGTANGQYKEAVMNGLDSLDLVKSAVWADFDNDGFKDLMILRFTPSEKKFGRTLFKSAVSVYKNVGGKEFKKTEGVLESGLIDYPMPAAVADFNNDGLLDMYIGYPGHRDFTTFQNFDGDKTKLKAQGIYLNVGNFTFKPSLMGADGGEAFEKFSEVQKIYPHSSLAADFNQDGKVDILVIDDRGNLSPLYVNTGDGKFVKANNKFQVANEGYGMGAATADINNDGLTDLLATSVHYSAFDRLSNSCQQNWGTNLEEGKNSKPISAYVGMKAPQGKTFVEIASTMGLAEPGEGLAGVEFIDYNNDGYEDIYVANGLWSGTDRFQDMASEFSRTKYLSDRMTLAESRYSTQSIVMQVLGQYKGDLAGNKGNERPSLSGFQRNRLYLNNKDSTFVEVGYLEGVDSIADGYVIAKADTNNDGKMDIILRNADPGSKDVKFSPVQIFKNNTANGNFLKVKLVGQESNKDAVGAEVSIETSLGKQTKQVIENVGTVQSDTALHFGLGENTKVKKLSIQWPSGKTTELKNVKMGNLVVMENSQTSVF